MLFYFLLGAGGFLLWKLKTNNTIKETIKGKMEDFMDVNRAVKINEKNNFVAFKKTLKYIAKMYWIMFLNRINNSVEHKGNQLVVSYVANGRLYKLLTKARKGPIVIQLVIDENGDDVSDEVLPFYGPERNWHKMDFTPEFWGKKKLIFELASGEAKEFLEKERIEIR